MRQMKIQTILAAIAAIAVVHGAAADADAEREYMAKNGGAVKISGKGRIALVDCRKHADEADCQSGVKALRNLFKPQIVWRKGAGFTIPSAAEEIWRQCCCVCGG